MEWNVFDSEEFKKAFKEQVIKDTWDRGRPMVYMSNGNIVHHWKDGTIEIVKTKEELENGRESNI